jgi:hypothetical protein
MVGQKPEPRMFRSFTKIMLIQKRCCSIVKRSNLQHRVSIFIPIFNRNGPSIFFFLIYSFFTVCILSIQRSIWYKDVCDICYKHFWRVNNKLERFHNLTNLTKVGHPRSHLTWVKMHSISKHTSLLQQNMKLL